MADFFTGLAKRTMGFEPIVKPLLASPFTPGARLMKESAFDADSLSQPSDAVQLSNTSAAMGEVNLVDPQLNFPLVASTGQGQQPPIAGVDFMVPGEDPVVQNPMQIPFRGHPKARPEIAPLPLTADPAPVSSEAIPPTQRMPAPEAPEEKQIDRGLPDSPDSIDAATSEFKVIHSQVNDSQVSEPSPFPVNQPVHQPTSALIEALPHSPLVRSPSSLPASASLPGLAADHPGRIEPNLGAIAPASPAMPEPQWQPQSSDVAGNLADSEGDPPPLSKPSVYPEIPQSPEVGVVQRQTAAPAITLPSTSAPQGQMPSSLSIGWDQMATHSAQDRVLPSLDSSASLDAAASEFVTIHPQVSDSQVSEPSPLPVHQPTSESIATSLHLPLVHSPSSSLSSASLPGLSAHHPGRIEPNLGAIAPASPAMPEPQWQPQSSDVTGNLADSEGEPPPLSKPSVIPQSPETGVVQSQTATPAVNNHPQDLSAAPTLPLVKSSEFQSRIPWYQRLPEAAMATEVLISSVSSFSLDRSRSNQGLAEQNWMQSPTRGHQGTTDVPPTLPAAMTVQVGGTPAPETFATARSVTSRQYLLIDELTSATLSGIAPRLESVRATPGDGQLPHSLFEPDHPRVMQGIRSEPAPTIQVRIGRVEVRRVNPPPEPSPSRQHLQQTPVLSLSDYLRQREGGEL